MITPLNIILVFIFMVLVPFILGLLFERFFENGDKIVFSRCFAMGLSVVLTLFLIPAFPMIYVGTSFRALLYVYSVILAVFLIISLILNIKSLKIKFQKSVSTIKEELLSVDKLYLILLLATLAIIAFQTSLLIFKMHTDTDDCRFLAESLEAIENNTLLRLHVITGDELSFPLGEMMKEVTAPYPLIISVLSVYTRMHPTVLAHVILPALLIPLCYATVYLLGKTILKDTKKTICYLYISSIVILFSFESIYSWGYTLLTIIWQGRSISAVIMLPLLWYIFIKVYVEEKMTPVLFIAALTVGLANSCLSGMGALMAPITGCVFAFANLVKNKKLISSILIGISVIPSGMFAIIQKLLW